MSTNLHATVYDTLILGAGPAGLSAALTLARIHRKAAVFSAGDDQSGSVMYTIPSRDRCHSEEFRSITRREILEKYNGIHFFDGTEIVRAAKQEVGGYDGFEVTDTNENTWNGRKLIVATGSKYIFPSIKGFAENWPRNM
jgi:gliotoxin/aspirochlorine biosynthesis thioredoxin reductase